VSTASRTYTTERDGGVEYQYDATWERFGNSVTWSARVRRRQGESFSVIDGQFNLGQSPGAVDVEAAVRRLVETSIEDRVGVD
jgi:hypothetical protein